MLNDIVHDYFGNALRFAIQYGTLGVWCGLFIQQGIQLVKGVIK